jgi:hypothetical protein
VVTVIVAVVVPVPGVVTVDVEVLVPVVVVVAVSVAVRVPVVASVIVPVATGSAVPSSPASANTPRFALLQPTTLAMDRNRAVLTARRKCLRVSDRIIELRRMLGGVVHGLGL